MRIGAFAQNPVADTARRITSPRIYPSPQQFRGFPGLCSRALAFARRWVGREAMQDSKVGSPAVSTGSRINVRSNHAESVLKRPLHRLWVRPTTLIYVRDKGIVPEEPRLVGYSHP